MKIPIAALALAAVSSVGHCQTYAPLAATAQADTDSFWREASGPQGEQNASAMPLYRAVFAHDREAASRLLAGGASPNASLFEKRWSVLMVATAYQDSQMIDLLSSHGADLNYVSNDPANQTTLCVALNAALKEMLHSGGIKPDFRTLYHLLEIGADTNVEFGYRNDVATFAASLGQMELVNTLLSHGYRRDLAELEEIVRGVAVNERATRDKQKVLQTIERLQRS